MNYFINIVFISVLVVDDDDYCAFSIMKIVTFAVTFHSGAVRELEFTTTIFTVRYVALSLFKYRISL